ncbi:caspase family protein [Actinoplanes sp. NPDC048988]|uniref:caspase family protein n=1 Tax=Actinoplanes sp. NPDC048988 TaxID=3363901 RepID=UPI00371EC864
MHRAVIIANSIFDVHDPAGEIPDLSSPPFDAALIKWALTNPRSGICAGDPAAVEMVLNEDHSAIVRVIEAVCDVTERDDTLLLYYSGHGFRERGGGLYLAGRDTDRRRLAGTAVSAGTLNAVLRRCPARRILVVLDACYSGAYEMDQLVVDNSYLITSAIGSRTARDGGPGEPSPFTAALARGLLGAAGTRPAITADGLWAFLSGVRPEIKRRTGSSAEIVVARFRDDDPAPWQERWWSDALAQAAGAVGPRPGGAGLSRLDAADRDRLRDLSIFPGPVSLDVFGRWWDTTEVREALSELADRWSFVAVTGGAARLTDGTRELIAADGDLRASAPGAHRSLVESLRRTVPGGEWWRLPAELSAVGVDLPGHLRAAGLDGERHDLVLDLRWIQATIRWTGSTAAAEAGLLADGSPVAVLLREALARCAHLLDPRSDAFTDTLLSRIDHEPTLRPLVERFRATPAGPFLERVWPLADMPHPNFVRVLGAHGAAVRDCAAGGDPLAVWTVGHDDTVKRWSVAPTTAGAGHDMTDALLTPDGTAAGLESIAHSAAGRLVLGSRRRAHVRAETGGGPRLDLEHGRPVTRCAISADGRWVLAVTADSQPWLWDLAGEDPGHPAPARLRGHSKVITCCAADPAGDRFAVGSEDGRVSIWRMARPGPEPAAFVGPGYGSPVDCCSFQAGDPDERWLVIGFRNGTVAVHSGEALVAARTLHAGRVLACAAAAGDDAARGGLVVSAGYDDQIQLWWPKVNDLISMPGNGAGVRCCAVVPVTGTRAGGRSQVVTGNADGTVRLFSTSPAAASWEPPALSAPASYCCVSGDGGRVISGGFEAPRQWSTGPDAGPGPSLPASPATCAAMSEAGHLVTGHPDGRILVTSPRDGRRRLGTEGKPVTCCTVSPDGTRVAAGYEDGSVRRWDTRLGTVSSSRFAAHGAVRWCGYLPGTESLTLAQADGTVTHWPHTGDADRVAPAASGDRGATLCAAQTADGNLIFLGTESGRLGIIRLSPRYADLTRAVRAHDGAIRGCAVDPRGALLATADSDGLLRVWRLTGDPFDPRPVAAVRLATPANDCAWLPDGEHIAVAGDGGTFLFRVRSAAEGEF